MHHSFSTKLHRVVFFLQSVMSIKYFRKNQASMPLAFFCLFFFEHFPFLSQIQFGPCGFASQRMLMGMSLGFRASWLSTTCSTAHCRTCDYTHRVGEPGGTMWSNPHKKALLRKAQKTVLRKIKNLRTILLSINKTQLLRTQFPLFLLYTSV